MDATGNLFAIGIANGGSPPDIVPVVPNHDGGFFIVSLGSDLQTLRYAVQAWRAPFARISVSADGRAFGSVDTRSAVIPDVTPLDPIQLSPGGGAGDAGLIALDQALLSDRTGRISRTQIGLSFAGLDVVLGR